MTGTGREPWPPGWFVASTDYGVGKTIVAGALACLLRQAGRRVGVFKPVATGCRRDPRLDLVSGDAEFLAHCADTLDTLETINPARYTQELDPVAAAERTKRPIDLDAIRESGRRIAASCDILVVEGVGSLLTPIRREWTMAELAVDLALPIILVAPAGLGAAGQVMLSVEAARSRGLVVAAVVLNRYESMQPTLAEELNPEIVASFARVSMPIVIPFDRNVNPARGVLPDSILDPLRPFVRQAIVDMRGG